MFITSDGIYNPTLFLHGTTDAVMCLQSTLAAMLPNVLHPHILWWLDDILIHSETIANQFKTIPYSFIFCASYNFKLHAAKCIVFATSIQ